ncbi:helix-turn-helix transcriptional regulator [Facklamia sp. P12934]|uniref:helix-turn-helix transcriptional regulator n=1 Tax=unclassified Facklamia TaxID=2622293 RepID=UPI003D185970
MNELKKLRNEEKITQHELAKKLGISYSLYVKIENRFMNPSYKVMAKLKKFYGGKLDLNKFFN